MSEPTKCRKIDDDACARLIDTMVQSDERNVAKWEQRIASTADPLTCVDRMAVDIQSFVVAAHRSHNIAAPEYAMLVEVASAVGRYLIERGKQAGERVEALKRLRERNDAIVARNVESEERNAHGFGPGYRP